MTSIKYFDWQLNKKRHVLLSATKIWQIIKNCQNRNFCNNLSVSWNFQALVTIYSPELLILAGFSCFWKVKSKPQKLTKNHHKLLTFNNSVVPSGLRFLKIHSCDKKQVTKKCGWHFSKSHIFQLVSHKNLTKNHFFEKSMTKNMKTICSPNFVQKYEFWREILKFDQKWHFNPCNAIYDYAQHCHCNFPVQQKCSAVLLSH